MARLAGWVVAGWLGDWLAACLSGWMGRVGGYVFMVRGEIRIFSMRLRCQSRFAQVFWIVSYVLATHMLDVFSYGFARCLYGLHGVQGRECLEDDRSFWQS